MLTVAVPQVNSAYDAATRLIRLSQLPYASSYEHTGRQRRFELFPIKFNRVRFRYPQRPDVEVLRDVSITIPQNSCIALVGSSGSGKSTIISLLLGLYPTTTSGGPHTPPAITLGGTDITRIHLPTLRSQIAVVPQHPHLFADTIRANIAYGLDPTSRLNTAGNVIAAAEAAGIDDFIRSLPQGYMTPVGAGGMMLSGGQAQRVAIARALVRRPRVLVLDEATSNLDAESAEVIRQSVQRLRSAGQGLTVILVTHAREMMEIADQVVVMDQGTVVEQGPYEALLGRLGGRLREVLGVEV
ncbi:hypothetical protein VTN31DRAFT_2946 [Thermomyces dupontii]|uniref:uncharacterized protein n=1 Tax=Talaromyces thermophilus TaxID=28565 RepID=UPI0037431CBA